MSESLLALEGIRHRYDEAADWELNVPAFEVREADVVGILGPNGSGKSTLLRIAAGTLRALEGAVLLEGVELARMDRRWIARRLGYLPQNVESQFDYKVEEVAGMGRYAHGAALGASGTIDAEAVERSLVATDVERLRSRRLSHLSGGERQRVFLASVLAQEPRVLLLDEPTRHLDVHHQVRFFRLLCELARQGLGVAVVTHDLNLAALYCRRVLVLKDGKPFRDGTVDEVLREDVLQSLYGSEIVMGRHPRSGRRIVLPADEAAGPPPLQEAQ